jgi:D-2-hydroxyacid dehydrogenase (NADP+)
MKFLIAHNIDDGSLERLRSVSPEIEVIMASTLEDAVMKVADADAVYSRGSLERNVFLAGKKLIWVQIGGAGVEDTLYSEMVESDVVLTNSSGAFDIPISDHIFAMILCFARGLNMFLRHQIEGVWKGTSLNELARQTILIIGLGSIGMAVAQRAHGFDMRIMAVDAMEVNKPEYVERVEKPEKLHELLPNADFIAICCPLTQKTYKLIGEAEFQKMKPTAYIINPARGKIIDESAMILALSEKRIAGAGLDVFEQEPLPSDSPLWKMPNVIITTHSAGGSPVTGGRIMDIVCENMRRFLAGKPLINIVNKNAGF